MMNDKVIGLVMKQIEYRENDALLTVLTKEYGKITLVARGVQKMTSKNSMSCMPYCISEYLVDYIEDKTMFTIKNGALVVSNRQIQENLEKMNVAATMCELVDKSLPTGVVDEEVNGYFYDLLEFSLAKLNTDDNHALLLALFVAQMLTHLGVPPVVDECVVCGNTKVHRISIEEGGFACFECIQELRTSNQSQMDLKKFRYINKAGIEHFEVLKNHGPWTYEDCETLFKFLSVHTGINSYSWDFLKTIVEVL